LVISGAILVLAAGFAVALIGFGEDPITQDTVDKIREGMTAGEVVAVIGREPDAKCLGSLEDGRADPNGTVTWWWRGHRYRDQDDREHVLVDMILVQFSSKGVVELSDLVRTPQTPNWLEWFLTKTGF
jgi:hypothetical protein